MIPFTDREQTVARMMAIGLRSKQIAAQVGMTDGSLKQNVIKKVYDKSGMSTRLEFALWYWEKFPSELQLKHTAETL